MTDYTQLADALLACQKERDELARDHAELEAQIRQMAQLNQNRCKERNELRDERDRLAEEVRLLRDDQKRYTAEAAYDRLKRDDAEAERNRLAAEVERLTILCNRDKTWLDLVEENQQFAAEVERLRAKLTCPECGREIHAAHHLECSHERTGE